jgi:dienelactone hydrolase
MLPHAALASARVDNNDASLASTEDPASEHLYKFRIERGQFRTASGATRTYSLYIPEITTGLPAGPFPLVVLIHGFFMTGRQHAGNAENFAKHGFIALTPDLSKILLGEDTRMENVRDLLDEIRWLQDKEYGPLAGLVDANRVGIAGNSAGAAVGLEVVLQAQKTGVPIKAYCALDGVPWERTFDRISQLSQVRVLSLRAEPAVCNFHACILKFLARLSFKSDDVKITGAHHCDVENPTTLGCKCLCGSSSEKYREVFQRLTFLFFKETLNGASLDGDRDTFAQAVHGYAHDGRVVANLERSEPSALASTENTQ